MAALKIVGVALATVVVGFMCVLTVAGIAIVGGAIAAAYDLPAALSSFAVGLVSVVVGALVIEAVTSNSR